MPTGPQLLEGYRAELLRGIAERLADYGVDVPTLRLLGVEGLCALALAAAAKVQDDADTAEHGHPDQAPQGVWKPLGRRPRAR